MKKYKFDPHVHTAEGSACACSSGAEVAEAYKAAGYSGIVITDHFFNGNTTVPADLPWKERVERFCQGYENAKKRGDEIGLTVLFGWEYAYDGSDFLTYGLDKIWLLAHPEIMDMPIWEYANFARRFGGFVVHAHPFRLWAYIKKITLIPNNVDAVECVNMSNHDEENARAAWYAESFGLPATAGSDAHNAEALPGGGIITETEIKTAKDYAELVKSGRVTLIPKEGEVKLYRNADPSLL